MNGRVTDDSDRMCDAGVEKSLEYRLHCGSRGRRVDGGWSGQRQRGPRPGDGGRTRVKRDTVNDKR